MATKDLNLNDNYKNYVFLKIKTPQKPWEPKCGHYDKQHQSQSAYFRSTGLALQNLELRHSTKISRLYSDSYPSFRQFPWFSSQCANAYSRGRNLLIYNKKQIKNIQIATPVWSGQSDWLCNKYSNSIPSRTSSE